MRPPVRELDHAACVPFAMKDSESQRRGGGFLLAGVAVGGSNIRIVRIKGE